MTNLLALAERVEKLTGPDRGMDGLIACAIFQTISTDDDLIYRLPISKDDECAAGTYWLVQRSGRSLQTAPQYTESLDAAMTLVPEGMSVGMSHIPKSPESELCRAWIYVPGGLRPKGDAETLPLAITAASLRALARQREG